jgi:hypothetical protein
MIRFLLVFFILLSSCSTDKISEKQQLASKLKAKAAKEISQKYGLTPSGSGGQMLDEIKMLYLAFECRRPLTLDETRSLMVHCVNDFLITINENEEIRPYLVNYPFTAKNIEMAIFFQDCAGKDLGNLMIVSIDRGTIRYKVSDPSDFIRTALEESFDQAKEICK